MSERANRPDRSGCIGPTGCRRRGAATVEFALICPLFFTLILGILEFGRMVMVQQIITNAAREGARVAILPSTATATVTNQVDNYLTNGSISSAAATVTVSPNPPSSASSGSLVTVTVSIPYTSVSWIPSPFYLSSSTLTANCAMRTEN